MKSEAEEKFLALLRQPTKSKEEVDEKERFRALFSEELKVEVKDLSQELKDIGSIYIDPWDLVNTNISYPEAIDTLIKHVPKHYHDKNKEGIFRALTVKEAKGKANAVLMAEYNKIPQDKENLRWVIGNAIYIIVTKDDLESILSIVENNENGMSRHRFVLALGKIKSEKSEDALIRLLDDDEMVQYAIQALRRLNSQKAKSKVRTFINSPNKFLQKEVQKFFDKIG
jgi:hypothetical protein